MSRRDNAAARCATCHMHRALCLCDETAAVSTALLSSSSSSSLSSSSSSSSSSSAVTSRLLLLLHEDEAHKPTNSGALAARCLPHSTIAIGPTQQPVLPTSSSSSPSASGSTLPALMLFPSDDARVLTAADGPCLLVVPDGTWRQARKLRARTPGLSTLPCVTLPGAADGALPTTYRLRTEGRSDGLATFEAIARAFAILEGQERGPIVEAALLDVFRKMVDRTLWLRGVLRDGDVFGGIPAAARLHDPRGGLPREP